eukprot:5264205-Pyramimonas_sp.AAC.1
MRWLDKVLMVKSTVSVWALQGSRAFALTPPTLTFSRPRVALRRGAGDDVQGEESSLIPDCRVEGYLRVSDCGL